MSSISATTEKTNLIKEYLNQAYIDEEIFWKQKSRVMWLRTGDKNTSYFHSVSRTRRIKNTLTSIQDEHGVIQRGHMNIARDATNYFDNIYNSQNDISRHFPQVFQGFSQRVCLAMNEDLVRDISEEDIRDAVFQIGPHKAPGPD